MAGWRSERRPGDADREWVTTALAAARAEGRIDDAELARRSFTVRYAHSMAEFDGGILGEPEPGGRSGEDPAAEFFPPGELDVLVVAAIAARAGEVHDEPDRPVSLDGVTG